METFETWFDDHHLAECLASMRAKQCARRHGNAVLDRYFSGVFICRPDPKIEQRDENDPSRYVPPRRLWSRPKLSGRIMLAQAKLAKVSMLRHTKWVIGHGRLMECEWGRRFAEFSARVRARVARGEFTFAQPVSFAIEKPGKDIRFVTSFRNLEDKVILHQTAMYLRKRFDRLLLGKCYSFREDGSIDHTVAVNALRDFRLKFRNEDLFVAECDIRKFFDTIDHQVALNAYDRLAKDTHTDPLARKVLLAYLASYTSTETLLAGVRESFRSKCEEFVGKINAALEFVGGAVDRRVGVPQGGALSMLIANWVLDYADNRVDQHGKDPKLFYARYCDDIVIAHSDKSRCRAARDRYLRALRKLKLPYHQVDNTQNYGRNFYAEKSKGPYCWRAVRKIGPGKWERWASPWVSFLGNQVKYTGEIRVRQDSIDRHLGELRSVCRRLLGLYHAADNPESGIELRGGEACRDSVLNAMLGMVVSKGVGYMRNGPFKANNLSWMSAFPSIKGHDGELQLRRLDRARANLIFPVVRKLLGARFVGRPESYYRYLAHQPRPGLGKGPRTRIPRAGYFDI